MTIDLLAVYWPIGMCYAVTPSSSTVPSLDSSIRVGGEGSEFEVEVAVIRSMSTVRRLNLKLPYLRRCLNLRHMRDVANVGRRKEVRTIGFVRDQQDEA